MTSEKARLPPLRGLICSKTCVRFDERRIDTKEDLQKMWQFFKKQVSIVSVYCEEKGSQRKERKCCSPLHIKQARWQSVRLIAGAYRCVDSIVSNDRARGCLGKKWEFFYDRFIDRWGDLMERMGRRYSLKKAPLLPSLTQHTKRQKILKSAAYDSMRSILPISVNPNLYAVR